MWTAIPPAFRVKEYSLAKYTLTFLLLTFSTYGQSATTERLPERDLQHLRSAILESSSFKDRYTAEVWLVGMNKRLQRFVKDGETRAKILSLLHTYATNANLSPQLVLSVIEVESSFNHYALSHAGAQGLMQVMPFWKKHIGSTEDNLMDIETNLRYGCNILSHYLKLEKGDLVAALARYNGSVGKTWYPEKVLMAWERNWFAN